MTTSNNSSLNLKDFIKTSKNFSVGLTIAISSLFTGSLKGAGILGFGSILPIFFYYFHERVWNKVKWGTNQ